MRLIGFLETEDYVLEFSNTNSTTVEFEGITYEILPYEFKFPFKNPRSSKQQMEAAQSKGEVAGGFITVGGQSQGTQQVITTAISMDPSGITTKASQVIKLFQRICYLNINFGDKLGTFIDTAEKTSGAKREKRLDLVRQIGHRGWRGKLSEKKISGDFMMLFHWQIALYLLMWVL